VGDQVPFEDAWAAARGPLAACCRRLARNREDAEDLYQRVAVRAWRGWASFRGESAVLTWLVRIAEREANRLYAREADRWRREVPLLAESAEAAAPAPVTEPDLGWLPDVVAEAGRLGVLSAAECRVVAGRLAAPDAGWPEVAAELGLTAAACAVLHCRAVPKLRVLLFVGHLDALGGRDAVAAAFRRAGATLGPAEREAFLRVVLDGRSDYRRRGWQADLRRACGLVINHLDPGGAAGMPW
jgi:RNA polymerase sigma factor (sigma-70 family)